MIAHGLRFVARAVLGALLLGLVALPKCQVTMASRAAATCVLALATLDGSDLSWAGGTGEANITMLRNGGDLGRFRCLQRTRRRSAPVRSTPTPAGAARQAPRPPHSEDREQS